MLVEVGEVVAEHSVSYTEEKEQVQSVPGVGFEAEQRTAPSGCGRLRPEAEAWESGGGQIQGSGPETMATEWDAALLESEESA